MWRDKRPVATGLNRSFSVFKYFWKHGNWQLDWTQLWATATGGPVFCSWVQFGFGHIFSPVNWTCKHYWQQCGTSIPCYRDNGRGVCSPWLIVVLLCSWVLALFCFVIGGVVVVWGGIATLSLLSECAVVVGGGWTMVAGGLSSSFQWGGLWWMWDEVLTVVSQNTQLRWTMNGIHRLSFGCHVAHSNMAPGCCVIDISGGGMWVCSPRHFSHP